MSRDEASNGPEEDGVSASPAEEMATLLPQVKIVHGGEPEPEELAALVAGLMASRAAAGVLASREAGPATPRRGCWMDKGCRLGVLRLGPGAWRSSARRY